MTELLADLTSHRIEGYVPGRGLLSVPLISHVEHNLYVGGCLDGVALPEGIEHVVSLYPWERYRIDPAATRRVEWALLDSSEVPADDVRTVASVVASFVSRGPTLVHCQAGLNRSGLVAAYYLWWYGGHGVRAAIDLLRERRSPLVLCNEAFERWLLAREIWRG